MKPKGAFPISTHASITEKAKLDLSPTNLLSPPWGTEDTWQEANRIIGALVERLFSKLKSAVSLASSVFLELEGSFGILDDICLETCPHCPDPCCLNASPWFDYRDLVFLHLNNMAIPPGQPISSWNATCRYYHPQGCTLDRIFRPWICTWYLCAVQTANLKARHVRQWHDLSRTIRNIKILRKEMEDAFIQAIM